MATDNYCKKVSQLGRNLMSTAGCQPFSTRHHFVSFISSVLNNTPTIQPFHLYIDEIKKNYYQLDKAFYSPTANQFLENSCIIMAEYACGNRNSATNLLYHEINRLNFDTLVTKIAVDYVYRGRKKEKNDDTYLPFKSGTEMLHIPFEKRWRVSNQRYSYTGMPSFYVGESEQVVEEELLHESNHSPESLAIAKFKVKSSENLRILDLSHFFEIPIEKMDTETWKYFLKIWPLIILCSTRFRYPNEKEENIQFKQEYVIPQLLLELIFDKRVSNVSGIRYRSVHCMKSLWDSSDSVASNNNYIFPAKDNQNHGHSSFISRNFEFDSFVRN